MGWESGTHETSQAKSKGAGRQATTGSVDSCQRNVRIRQDPLIHRHEFAAVMSRRGNDDLIGRVAVKGSR